jgi:prepilin-type N-terminal cleavage/methylation domain-containing protein
MKIPRRHFHASQSGFTMMEIAICLAIIGIALVAIIGDLPLGMNVQKDNREQTVINQDATVFIEAIRNAQRGSDDLTNYVYAITNTWTFYKADGTVGNNGVNGYGYAGSSVVGIFPATPPFPINSGGRIVGLLSTPKYQSNLGLPLENLINNAGYSNHIVAYVRSMSGPAVEKPPQDNDLLRGDSFSYRIICDNVPVQTDVNANTFYNQQLSGNQQSSGNLHELRLTFLWPQQPNGALGAGRQTYRASIAGQVMHTNDVGNNVLFFYQSQSFTNVPPSP